MRAVIDLGTNSVLLLLGQREAGGRVKVHADQARVTRLGRGVAQTRRLDQAAVARTLEVLREYRAMADAAGAEIEAVATEGLRMAEDRDAFLQQASEVLGTELRMISGEQEALLSYRSVALEHDGAGPLRVLDIGGGSTELAAGHGMSCDSIRSHPIGSVRLTERFVDSDPPSQQALASIGQAARDAFATQPLQPHPELHGLAGTVTTSAALLLGLTAYDRDAVDGTRWNRSQVLALRDELAAQPLAERAARPCLPAGRADVIVAGLTILDAALTHCGAEVLVVRDRGLRFALL